MPRDAFEEAISAAVDGTSNEIFDSAFGKEESTLDETGDRTLESVGEGLEGQIEPEEEGETGEEGEEEQPGRQEEREPPVEENPEPTGRVPPGRLREQTERTRAVEAERDALRKQLEESTTRSRSEVAALNARFEGVLAALQRGQQPPKADAPVAPKLEDLLFEKPTEFVDGLKKSVADQVAPILEELRNTRVQTSLAIAHGRHGDTFTQAIQAIAAMDQNNPENQRLVEQLYNAPNPGEAVVAWHRRNVTLREVGDDPAKYKERLVTETRTALMQDPEFRKQILAELRTEAEGNGNGRPNTTVRLPPSLNGARGGGRESIDSSMLDDSQQGIFDQAFAPRSR